MTQPSAFPQNAGKTTVQQREKAFRRAQNHSRRVRLLKVALPVAAGVMALGFGAYAYLSLSSPIAVDLDVTNSAISDGKLVMANPKLDGFNKENLPYSMSAARAIQDLGNGDTIELEDISARMPVAAENWADIRAAKGVYKRDENRLDITGDLTVRMTDGTEANLKSAVIDIGKGDVHTNEPVDITLGGTRIAADSMTVLENGKVMVFERRVRIALDPGKVKSGGQMSNGVQDVVQ